MKHFRSMVIVLATAILASSCSQSNTTPQVNPEISSDCDTVRFSSLSDTVTVHLFSEYNINLFMPEYSWLEIEDKGSVEMEDPETGKTVKVKTVVIVSKKNLTYYDRDAMAQFRNDGFELNIPIYQEGKHFCDFYSVDDPLMAETITPFKDSLEYNFLGDTTFVAKPNEDNVFITMDENDWVTCSHSVLSAYSDPENITFSFLSENPSYEARSCKVYFKNQAETYCIELNIRQKGIPAPEPGPEEGE